jgi:hypothetical protein
MRTFWKAICGIISAMLLVLAAMCSLALLCTISGVLTCQAGNFFGWWDVWDCDGATILGAEVSAIEMWFALSALVAMLISIFFAGLGGFLKAENPDADA